MTLLPPGFLPTLGVEAVINYYTVLDATYVAATRWLPSSYVTSLEKTADVGRAVSEKTFAGCDGVWKESGSHQLTDGSPERELVAKLTVRRVFFSVWRLLGLQAQCRLSHTGFSKAGLADSDRDTNCGWTRSRDRSFFLLVQHFTECLYACW